MHNNEIAQEFCLFYWQKSKLLCDLCRNDIIIDVYICSGLLINLLGNDCTLLCWDFDYLRLGFLMAKSFCGFSILAFCFAFSSGAL